MEIKRKQKNSEPKVNKLLAIKPLKTFIVFALAILSLSSCKTKKIKDPQGLAKNNAIKEIIDLHYTKDFKFSTLQSRLRVTYDDGQKSISPSASLRIEKDKQIWLSVKFLGITMAKAYITPERVSFYEKLNRNFYDGDFKALSNFLGTDVNFDKVQNLLLGQSILELKNQTYNINTALDNQVLITPEKQDPLYEILLGLYASSYKVSQLQISQESKSNAIKVTYPEYQKIIEQDFPKRINIITKSSEGSKRIDVEYKTISANTPLTFPYKIPDGYTAFIIK